MIRKKKRKKTKKQLIFFLIVTHFIITNNISLVKVQTNYCNNNLLILDVKQLNKIKLYHFHTLKALWDSQGKIKMYYGMSRFKKQLLGKRSIAKHFALPVKAKFTTIKFTTISSTRIG